MAGGDLALAQRLLHGVRQVQQPKRVGDVAAGLADGLAERLLGELEPGEQAMVAVGLVHRVEVLALQVLHQGDGGGLGVRHFVDQRGDFVQPAAPAARQRRSPATIW